ncbi:MAG: hypothetical protein QOJ65_2826 [Fimbriimonadaceae bacterium]|jgi:undecaprenyl-diphosphatase|nr:hypothetical protein [Fimbriimonadaceae bacterium]
MWGGFISSDRLAEILKPSTLGFLGVMAAALVTVSVLVRVPSTLLVDLAATRGLQRANSKFLNKAAGWLTFMGNSSTLVLLTIGVVVICAVNHEWKAALFIALSLVTIPLNVFIKSFFDRKRPGEDEVRVHAGPRWGTSYPSGHAMCSTAYYGFLAYLVWLHMTDPMWRWVMLTPLVLLPIGVSLSRVYVGAHWMSDVIGGMAAGMILLVFLAAIYPV